MPQDTLEVPETEIAGWFDFEAFYDRAIESAQPGDTIVEIGVFCGKSLSYLANAAENSGKNLRIVGIDSFQGSEEFDGKVFFNDRPLSAFPHGSLAQIAMRELARFDVLRKVTVIVADSAAAADFFENRSVHAVFIDGDHTCLGVNRDILAWWKKMKSGGIFGGHDYHAFPTVKEVVDHYFPQAITHPDRSWWEIDVV